MTQFNKSISRSEIAQELGVRTITTNGEYKSQIDHRVRFIKKMLRDSKTESLVLGISGGVDSLTAGRLCQLAVDELKAEGYAARFIAVRLPFRTQKDEKDAQASLDFICPDEIHTINIEASVEGMMAQLPVGEVSQEKVDFIKGNVKARARMIAQYALANLHNGLVVGTDHAAEAVMGFFTKFGDGACDLTPLAGLVKDQVRMIAEILGAPSDLVYKTPTADLEELDPGKPDEVAYGCTYDDIDKFLLGQTVSAEVEDLIIGIYERTAHKRALPYAPQ
ncbi:ammonia-dependent NAD(+) synthetase [Pseudomonas viridiflava]|uniref:ammonia-dependent NAD(+) synthetase n=1 Tax=Pseudomonas viridiflava TaxID=33069 RepID=UPI0018E5DFB6|nr:ammonia-dependent NAD(+) synthetase [Pseudomonas viridiflava]MBI6727069.1 ammonia-dependent NAD(+) synthetase [Pseudomonas viridiflava]